MNTKKTGLFLLVVLTGMLPWSCSKQNGKIEWEIQEVSREDIVIDVTATGTLESVSEVEVGTQVSGIVEKLFVDYNSHVKKGQVIARIDTITLAAQVRENKASLTRSKVALRQAERDYLRLKQLYEEKVVSELDYLNAWDTYETAQANMESARIALDKAETNLGYAIITSPIDGVVIDKQVEEGQTVAASFNSPVLFSIVHDLSEMQVEASIDEADIGQIKLGQKVSFEVDAYPDEQFSGTIKQIRLAPEIVSNVVTYKVIIDVPNPDLKLMPGMTANIDVMVNEAMNVLAVPTRAISFSPPQSYLDGLATTDTAATVPPQPGDEQLAQIRERMKQAGMSDDRIDGFIENIQSGNMPGPGSMPGFSGTVPGIGQGMFPGGDMTGESGFSGQSNNGTGDRYSGPQTLWIMDENDSIRSVRVMAGLSDGRTVAVSGPGIREGTRVIVSVNEPEAESNSNSNRRGPGGFPPF